MRTTVFYVALMLLAPSFTSIAGMPENNVHYWCVFIGIADYNGTEYDLPTFEEFLYNGYYQLLQYENWKEDHIRLLIDEDAISKNILEALDWLSMVSDDNDVVIFWYDGHGTEILDEDGDEEDGFDEAIVAWEATREACITDDILSQKLNKIKADGIAIILDCCLSDEFINETKKVIHRDMWHDYNMGMNEDIDVNGRVILTSAYGDGLSWAAGGMGSPCTFYVSSALNRSSYVAKDGICSAEEVFRFSQIYTDFYYCLLPFYGAIFFGWIGGLSSMMGAILFHSNPFLSFWKGAIGGFILGFSYISIIILFLEIDAYTKTKHWVLPFPQIYDGYEGDLVIASS